MRRLVRFSIAFAVCAAPEVLAVPKQEPDNAVRGLQNAADQQKLQFWVLPDPAENVTKPFIERMKKEASVNDPKAQASLAACYYTGRGVARDLAKAVEWYQKAAANGHAGAQNNLGCLYEEGTGVLRDLEKAYQLFLSAARQHLPHGQYNLAACYAKGTVVKQDWAAAVEWYRKAASQGHLRAMNNLGFIYLFGSGVPVDLEAAKKYLRAPAEAGLAISQYALGAVLSKQGYLEAAAHWFRRSAQGGEAAGQLFWAVVLFEGKGVKRDLPAALEWARKASKQGNVEAQALAARILFGDDDKTLADPREAERYARQAAEQGHAGGQHLLGLCYHRGTGVDRDLTTAVQWYTRAAEQKHAAAAGTLGLLYEKGVKELPVSFQEAAKWYRVGAEAGDKLSQYRLGLCYRDGTGVDVDLAEAEKWLRLAVVQFPSDSAVKDALAQVERLRANQPAIRAESDFRRGFELAQQGDLDVSKFREATEYLHKAADAGHAGAQALLAGMYRRGLGLQQDEAKAEELVLKASSSSDPRVLHLIGMSYTQKDRIPPEHASRVLSFFQRAALQGYLPAQNSLGYALMSGVGANSDRVEAYKWLSLAAAKGHRRAQANLRRLRSMLMSEEVEEGKRRAKSFQPIREKAGGDRN